MKPSFGRFRIRRKERKHRWSLTLMFSAVVFFVLVWAIALAALAVYLLLYFGVIGSIENAGLGTIVLFMLLISALIGATISIFVLRIPLKPVNRWINCMNRLAEGDFAVRMRMGKPLADHPDFVELSDSFNQLAEELENTEMLRGDFINNFSHEFKTPIVSIAGLAKLLKKGNLTEEQRQQYLDAIEQESMRLSYMATNMLNLTKVENQTILSDVTTFNLSEQIRSGVLLLENKWSKKNIDLQLNFEEYEIEANEELLKQVWINLIDNAVKFSPEGGTVSLEIQEIEGGLRISVGNTGSEIPPDKLEKIWNKFYQADESHSSEGNGIGLAIVRRIVILHGGDVEVKSEAGKTVFSIILPRNQ